MFSQNLKTNFTYVILMTVVMSLVWIVSIGVFMGMAGVVDTTAVDPLEAAMSSLSLVLVSFLNVLVVVWLVNRTHLSGFKLSLWVFGLLFGVMFFMTQIETVFFNSTIEMPLQVVGATVAAGALAAASLSLVAIRLRRKLGRPAIWNKWVDPSRNVTKLMFLAVTYMIFYYVFGYYIAWQVPGLREFYSGSTEILPFGQHMGNELRNNITLPIFQVVRGLMWAGFGYFAIIGLGQTKLLERIVLVGLVLSVGLATPLLIPNEFMPDVIRSGHFFELLAENFVFGALVALVFRPSARG